MKHNFTLSSLFLIIAILFTACPSPEEKDEIELADLDLVEIDSAYFDSIDAKFESSDSLKFLGLGKGATWRMWRRLHKGCMESAWLRRSFYFGVTSTVNLGSIVSKDLTLQRVLDEDVFTTDEIKRIVNYGSFADCGYTRDMSLSLDVFIQSQFDFTQDLDSDASAELSAAIKNSNSTKVKIDFWRVNNLVEQNLLDILKDATDAETGKKRYYETLKNPNNRIQTKVVEIKGFTSQIILDSDMSAKLEAELKEGVTASLGNTGINSNFRFENKRTIEVKSEGNFFVFGEFKKAKKVR